MDINDFRDNDSDDDFLSLEDDEVDSLANLTRGITLDKESNNNNRNSKEIISNSKLELMKSLRDKGWGSGMFQTSLSSGNMGGNDKVVQPYSYKDDKQSPWYEERQVIATLYRARVLLHEMIESKMNQERMLAGNLCVSEIQSLLNTQKEDVETDWIAEIQELKRNMIAEIRRNHVLERDLVKLDKRIALLIKHRSNIKELVEEAKKTNKKKKTSDSGNEFKSLDSKQIESYQNLFYLLQTEPHYLAKLVTMIQPDQMEDFLDTVFLSLFGDAFSPREEFLILNLFRLAITQEMSAIKSAADLISVESVVPKMIITYTRRKQGHEYLKQIIAPILENGVVNVPDLNLELNAVQVYQNMISEEEIKTGAKSTSNRGLGEDQILKLKEVQAILEPRIQKCIAICERFFVAIVQSLNRLPYGIRWICKQIQNYAVKNFNSKPDEIAKVIGYFVYYRFINLAIVTPDTHNILAKEVSNTSIKNLVCIAKVLHNLFTIKTFQNQGSEKWLQPLNQWIISKSDTVRQYFEDLVQVSDPSEYLRVDRYNELTLKLNPVVVISLGEISQTHKLLLSNLNSLKMKDKEDPMELILKSLPPPFDVQDENDREIQLTLTNRFKEQMEKEISTSASLFTETKELVIQVLRSIPVQTKAIAADKENIHDILKNAIDYAQKQNNHQLTTITEKVINNLKKLEQEGTVQSSHAFIHVIALEVINRQEIREHQRKERMRLTIALRDLRKHQSYLNDQIHQYTNYLKDILLHYGPKDKKKNSKPIKISYKDLLKKGIIVESDIPKISQSSTSFHISSSTPGIFDIEAKIGIATAGSISLSLDDLLDKSYSGGTVLKLDNIVLDVNMTLHLLNKHFLKNI